MAEVKIIGAGPSGLMAAEVLASAGHRVTIHDAMASPARKVLLAGGGGVNLTQSRSVGQGGLTRSSACAPRSGKRPLDGGGRRGRP